MGHDSGRLKIGVGARNCAVLETQAERKWSRCSEFVGLMVGWCL